MNWAGLPIIFAGGLGSEHDLMAHVFQMAWDW